MRRKKAIIMAMEPKEANEASRPYLSTNYPGLYNCFNSRKINPEYWAASLSLSKNIGKANPLKWPGLHIFTLKTTEVLCQPNMAWAKWYEIFCERCGIAPNTTYQKDSKKVGIDGMPIKRLWDELNQTMFIKGGRGDALNKPHVGFHDGHQY